MAARAAGWQALWSSRRRRRSGSAAAGASGHDESWRAHALTACVGRAHRREQGSVQDEGAGRKAADGEGRRDASDVLELLPNLGLEGPHAVQVERRADSTLCTVLFLLAVHRLGELRGQSNVVVLVVNLSRRPASLLLGERCCQPGRGV